MIRAYLARTTFHAIMTVIYLAPVIIGYTVACVMTNGGLPDVMSFATVATFWLGLILGALFGLS